MANLTPMTLRGLPFVLVGSLLLALACGDGGEPDDEGTTLRPRITGPVSDFPVRGGGLDAGTSPVLPGPSPQAGATPGGGTAGDLGGAPIDTGGVAGGGVVVGGGTGGGGTGGGGTGGGGISDEPALDAGTSNGSDAGTPEGVQGCTQDASGCPTDAGEEGSTPTEVGLEASTPTELGPEASTPTEVGPEAGTSWPGADAWPGWR